MISAEIMLGKVTKKRDEDESKDEKMKKNVPNQVEHYLFLLLIFFNANTLCKLWEEKKHSFAHMSGVCSAADDNNMFGKS